MKQWLEDRGKPVPMEQADAHGDMKAMMDHMNMGSMPLMPGMLTPEQMKALATATRRGLRPPVSDRHDSASHRRADHGGGSVRHAGAGQDAVLFDFATDVDNTQRAEIKIMQGMLKEKK